MAAPVRTTHARLALEGDHSRAVFHEAAGSVTYGGAGASALDHIVAAVGACMFETLALALAARGVNFDRSTFSATVTGAIAGRAPATQRITAIDVRYALTIPAAHRAAADRALRFHPRGCPAHETLREAIPITWSAHVTEL